MNATTTPRRPDPLRRPDVLILDLTTEQALPFAQLGECFAVVGRGSYPGHVGRLCLYALPVSHSVAVDACNVALGSHRATRIKQPTAPPIEPSMAADAPQTRGWRKSALTAQR